MKTLFGGYKQLIGTVLVVVLSLFGYDAIIEPSQDVPFATTIPVDSSDEEQEDVMDAPLNCGGEYIYRYGAWYQYELGLMTTSSGAPNLAYIDGRSDYAQLEFCKSERPTLAEFSATYNRNKPDSLKRNITKLIYTVYRGKVKRE